ncbi:MAG: glucose 1-dehydrogenase [Syntrophales bacterium]|jgi:NAD(P)-dependent dehydrogenase (short-subunit alcohol dehydrogenase family)|nr:glucose 1-dehydrogenase [Syntrophales bacterium]
MNTLELFRLDGRVALVTGGAQGLGKDIALTLAQSGASLIVADLTMAEETVKQAEAIGARCIAIKADISKESDVEKMTRQAIGEYGKVDVLVNNAGISQLNYVPTENAALDEWDKVIAVNLRGTYLCCKHIGKEMIKSGGGNIVNISTTAGITGVARAPAYCASKAGVLLLTKSLALEWARYNIRVNAIALHYIETALSEGLRASEKVYKGLIKQIPLRRFGKTSEIVGVALLLASEASSYMTGSVVAVDGGYLAQ